MKWKRCATLRERIATYSRDEKLLLDEYHLISRIRNPCGNARRMAAAYLSVAAERRREIERCELLKLSHLVDQRMTGHSVVGLLAVTIIVARHLRNLSITVEPMQRQSMIRTLQGGNADARKKGRNEFG